MNIECVLLSFFLPTFYQYVLLYVYTVSRDEGCVERELNGHIMIERVEMIARLASESSCRQRDREIALNWIAEIVKDDLSAEKNFSNDTHAA